MATTTFRGIVKKVFIENYGEVSNPGKRQTLIILVPGYVDQYGEKRGADEMYEINQFNESINKNPISADDIDRKIEVEVYLKGREFDKKDGSGKAYAVGLNVKSFTLREKTQYPLPF